MVADSPENTATQPAELRPSHGCLIFATIFSAVVVTNVAAAVAVLFGHGWSPAQLQDATALEQLTGDPLLIFGSALASQAVFLTAVPLAMKLSRLPASEILALRPVRPVTLALAALGLLGFSLVGDGLIALLRQVAPATQSVMFELGALVRDLPALPRLLAVLGIALIPACCEEALFRGVLFTAFLRRWGPVATVVATALLFGLTHLDPLQSPAAILLGGYLGLIRLRTGSLLPAAAAHAANNLAAMGLALADAPGPPGPFAAWLVGGLVVGLAVLPWLRPADEQ